MVVGCVSYERGSLLMVMHWRQLLWIAFGWLSMVVVDSRGWVWVLWIVKVIIMGREVTIDYAFRSSSICVGLLFLILFGHYFFIY